MTIISLKDHKRAKKPNADSRGLPESNDLDGPNGMGRVLSLAERLAERKRKEALIHLLKIQAGMVKGRWIPMCKMYQPIDAQGEEKDISLMSEEEQKDYLEAFEQQDKIAERRKQITLIHSTKENDDGHNE